MFLLKKFNSPTVINNEIIIPKQEPLNYKVNIKERKYPEYIYNSNGGNIKVNDTGGELVPFNLSDGEKELLNMFYGKE